MDTSPVSSESSGGRPRRATGIPVAIVLLTCAAGGVAAEPGDLQVGPLKPFPEGLEIPAFELAPMSPGCAWTSVGERT